MESVLIKTQEGKVIKFRSMRNAIRTLRAVAEVDSTTTPWTYTYDDRPIIIKKTFGCSSAYAKSLLDSHGYQVVEEGKAEQTEEQYRAEQSEKSEAYKESQKEMKEKEKKEEQKEEKKEEKRVNENHHQFDTLLTVISCRLNALLVGPAGSGKTTAAEKVAEKLGLPFYSISVGNQTTKHEFFGYQDANGRYVRSLFREAYENGGVFLIDEMDAGNSNVIISINSALANGVCAFADGMVNKHPDFIVIASANTFGNGANAMFVGRNQLDGATNDRFVTIYWEYDLALEERLCENKKWLTEVRRIRAIVEKNKMRYIISPRASMFGAKLLNAGMEWEQVMKMVIYKGMNETEKQLLK
jgi:DNA polymerase III delta prime subunit